jgi:hypothetical protein
MDEIASGAGVELAGGAVVPGVFRVPGLRDERIGEPSPDLQEFVGPRVVAASGESCDLIRS